MENPATWGPAERIVNDVLANDDANRTRPIEEWTIGLSRARQITDALRAAGLLVDPDICRCGHPLGTHLNTHEVDGAYLCRTCGDNTHCNYADDEEIAAGRWEEGYVQAVVDLIPEELSEGERLLWVIMNPPKDNPYQPDEARTTP